MSILIGSSLANGSMTRMQAALAAAKAAEPTRKKNAVEAPVGDQITIKGVDEKAGLPLPRRTASSDGPRVEVDRRTEDSKSVKITVISYSDGSSESVTLMKADELTAQISNSLAKSGDVVPKSSEKPLFLTNKGLLVNKIA